jgi:hypothetical protein
MSQDNERCRAAPAIRVGRQRYAIDWSCSVTLLPPQPDPVPHTN